MATIRDLAKHPSAYVTVGELAEYWEVSRRRVYLHIEEGALPAMRLGPRSYRIRTNAAAEFERRISSLRAPMRACEPNGPRGVQEPAGRRETEDR
jgi:excisionase family DNA binding protein